MSAAGKVPGAGPGPPGPQPNHHPDLGVHGKSWTGPEIMQILELGSRWRKVWTQPRCTQLPLQSWKGRLRVGAQAKWPLHPASPRPLQPLSGRRGRSWDKAATVPCPASRKGRWLLEEETGPGREETIRLGVRRGLREWHGTPSAAAPTAPLPTWWGPGGWADPTHTAGLWHPMGSKTR